MLTDSMITTLVILLIAAALEISALPKSASQKAQSSWKRTAQHRLTNIQLGPRPQYLVDAMDEDRLKDQLSACSEAESRTSKFSIGHRGGACMQFPEETLESIMAGSRMGAGIQECDVAFTSDRELVCRHDQCDLHMTTDILTTELAAKCTAPFTPASNGTEATATCCTSDITLAEFKSLCGKMEGYDASATTPEAFLGGTPDWRTNLYSTCGTVLSHKEFIELVDSQGLDFTSELKEPRVPMPFDGDYTHDMYAQQLIDEYRAAGISPSRVWPQSFLFRDVAYWLRAEPEFGKQAILLDESADDLATLPDSVANLTFYRDSGVQVVGPPLSYLVSLDENNEYVPSSYATTARDLGLKIVTWSLERSGPLANVKENGDYYYSTIANGTDNDGDMFKLVDVLAREVGVLGIFSDWSATVTYYANCFGYL
ncbi:glycerophosphoryl diester phosphodiesterase family protein [Xylariomycetidae sp. FL2044]|nr:glycerophosphoryl diester phosphodiesterase family protein [Xylariomycetidae sp. FL2044]